MNKIFTRKQKLVINLVKEQAIEYGDFTLKSGLKSSYYLDCRKITISSNSDIIADAFIEFLFPLFPFDAVGGPALGACPIVTAISSSTATRACYIRNDVKDHGKKDRIIGSILPNDRVVVVEDVTTSGGSLLDAVKALQEFGQKVGTAELTFPEWAQVTVYRMVKGQRVEFVGPKVYWLETYAVQKRDDDTPNQMWRDRPRGQIEKCAEASALRAAFPEEVGCDYIPEEVQGQRASAIETTAVKHKDNSLESLTKQLTAKEPGTEPSEVDAVSDVAGESVSEAEEKALLEDASVQDSIDEALKVLAWSPPNKDSKLTAICKQKFSLSRLEDCSVEQKREVLTWLEGQLEQ